MQILARHDGQRGGEGAGFLGDPRRSDLDALGEIRPLRLLVIHPALRGLGRLEGRGDQSAEEKQED